MVCGAADDCGQAAGGGDERVSPKMPRYIDWNYDTGEAVEYAREGECNGCGACCTTVIRFTSARDYGDSKLGAKGTDQRGLWHELREEDGTRRFYRTDEVGVTPSRCPMLDAANRCKVHFEKIRCARNSRSRRFRLLRSESAVIGFEKCSGGGLWNETRRPDCVVGIFDGAVCAGANAAVGVAVMMRVVGTSCVW